MVDRPSAMLISPSINYLERDDDHQHFTIISFQRLPAAVHQSIHLPRPQAVMTQLNELLFHRGPY